MTSKNLFYNYFVSSYKRYVWSFSLSCLLFFLSIILPVTMWISNTSRFETDDFSVLVGSGNLVVKWLLILLPIIMSTSAFSFIHNKSKTDLLLSLPISRGKLFLCEYVWSASSVLLGYIACILVSVGIVGAMGYAPAISWADIGIALAEGFVYFNIIYVVTAIAAILCGNTVIGIIISQIFLYSVIVVYLISIGFFQIFYETYNNGVNSDWIVRLSPVINYFANGLDYYSVTSTLIYFVLWAILTFVAYLLFKYRKGESSGNPIAFKGIKIPLEVYVSYIVGLTMGLMFYGIMSDMLWMYFGAALGAFLAHIFTQVAYEFTFKSIFTKLYVFAASTVVCFAFIAVISNDLTGFDERTISADQVESYTIDAWGHEVNTENFETYDMERLSENTDALELLIEEGAKVKPNEIMLSDEYFTMEVDVKLKGFGSFKRRYEVYHTEENIDAFRQIFYSQENIEKNFWINNYNITAFENIQIEAGSNSYGVDSAEYRDKMVNAYKNDVANIIASGESLNVDWADSDYTIRFEFDYESDDSYYTSYYRSYSETVYIDERYVETYKLAEEYLDQQSMWVSDEIVFEDIISLGIYAMRSNDIDIKTEYVDEYVLQSLEDLRPYLVDMLYNPDAPDEDELYASMEIQQYDDWAYYWLLDNAEVEKMLLDLQEYIIDQTAGQYEGLTLYDHEENVVFSSLISDKDISNSTIYKLIYHSDEYTKDMEDYEDYKHLLYTIEAKRVDGEIETRAIQIVDAEWILELDE